MTFARWILWGASGGRGKASEASVPRDGGPSPGHGRFATFAPATRRRDVGSGADGLGVSLFGPDLAPRPGPAEESASTATGTGRDQGQGEAVAGHGHGM